MTARALLLLALAGVDCGCNRKKAADSEDLERGFAPISDSPRAEMDATEAKLLLARSYLAQGSPNKALTLLRELHEADPNHLSTELLLARTEAETGQEVDGWPASLARLVRLSKRHPNSEEVFLELAAHQERFGSAKKAEPALRQALAIASDKEPVLRLLAENLAAQGKSEEAAELLQKASQSGVSPAFQN